MINLEVTNKDISMIESNITNYLRTITQNLAFLRKALVA